MRGKLIVVSGPSGVGKDTIVSKYLEKNSNTYLSVSCTSRAPREGEVDGVNYIFLSREEFEERISNGDFLEYAEYNGNYYGTPKYKMEEELEKGKDVILVIEVQGALKVKELIPDALFIFILPPSINTLKERLIGRGTEDIETINKRIETALNEIKVSDKYDYNIVNDELDMAVLELEKIIQKEKTE
jgi:guanylate kinase